MNKYLNKTNISLNPWWLTGYTDGEGNFTIKTVSASSTKIGYTVRLIYQITVHPCDIDMLYKIQAYFDNVGKVEIYKDYVSYRITRLSDILRVVIPILPITPFTIY